MVIATRPLASATMRSSVCCDIASEGEKPSRSTLVESQTKRVNASIADLAQPRFVDIARHQRGAVDLPVAGMKDACLPRLR